CQGDERYQGAADRRGNAGTGIAADRGAKAYISGLADGHLRRDKGVDPEDFRSALEHGVEMLHADGADVVFMNMQYSPRTDAMISINAYADTMRWVALQHEVPLFDRFALMKHWAELGTFDLYDARKNTDTAERVHDCIGRLLAALIAGAIKQPAPAAEKR